MALPAPVKALIESEGVKSVLCMGFDSNAGEHPLVTPEQLLEESLGQRVDLVAIGETITSSNPATRNEVIAKCRDQLSQRVMLELSQNDESGMTETECLALGFVRCAITERNRYYLFDLKTYKPAPDWLNPKFWANPQNWDKYRW